MIGVPAIYWVLQVSHGLDEVAESGREGGDHKYLAAPPRLRYVVPAWIGPAGNHVSPYHTRALRMQQEAAMTICAVYALTDQQADRKAYEFVSSPGIEIVANLSFSG